MRAGGFGGSGWCERFFSKFVCILQTRASRRSLPCQAEEEGHQLAFIQKHLPSLLSLLAQSTIEDGDQDAKVRSEHKIFKFEVDMPVSKSLSKLGLQQGRGHLAPVAAASSRRLTSTCCSEQ